MELWVEKYRPKTIEDYVFQDEGFRKQVEGWIKQGSTDNLLLSGPPGTGKTSLSGVLVNELEVSPSDILKINASRVGNVDTIRDQVYSFASSGGWEGLKYVLMDEADGLTHGAQFSLKDVLEQYSNTCRFIFTANYRNKIIPAVQDRFVKVELRAPDIDAYTERMVNILQAEGIDISSDESIDALDTFIKSHYPSIRACIRDLQRHSLSGKLVQPNAVESGSDWKVEMIELFKRGQIKEARELVCRRATKEEMEETYTFLYNNRELITKDPIKQEMAIVVIRDGMYKHSLVADPEINLAATMVELQRL